MGGYGSKLKSIVEILSELQIELDANQMLGEGILELKVSKRFFDKLKMELVTPKNKVVLGSYYEVFAGSPSEVEEFEKWDETEIHLPCGKLLVRSIS